MSYPAAIVELDGSELRLVEYVAQERSGAAARLGRTPILGERELAADVLGAAAEYALSRFTGLVWNAVRDNLHGLADLDGAFECKAIHARHHCLLIPKAKLRRERVYFLAFVKLPRVEILGAVEGSKIKRSDLDTSLPVLAYRIRQQDPRFVRDETLERYRAERAEERKAA